MRNPNRLQHLERILRKTDTRKMDIVVLSVRISKAGSGEGGLEPDQMFADAETQVFSKVVNAVYSASPNLWRRRQASQFEPHALGYSARKHS